MTGIEPAFSAWEATDIRCKDPDQRGFSHNPSPRSPRELVESAAVRALSTVLAMLMTIDDAAARLRVHRTTIWRLIKDDASFPPLLYIRPRCPRLRETDVDRWAAGQAVAPVFEHVSPDLLVGKARGPMRRRRAA
jgi:predicted DNA-binding transcriptional regulator AlpA